MLRRKTALQPLGNVILGVSDGRYRVTILPTSCTVAELVSATMSSTSARRLTRSIAGRRILTSSWDLSDAVSIGANLGYALLHAGTGVFTLPFESGHRLLQGLHGATFSVPELFFVNIRKGTFEFVPREDP